MPLLWLFALLLNSDDNLFDTTSDGVRLALTVLAVCWRELPGSECVLPGAPLLGPEIKGI